jgi:hypothetical protein
VLTLGVGAEEIDGAVDLGKTVMGSTTLAFKAPKGAELFLIFVAETVEPLFWAIADACLLFSADSRIYETRILVKRGPSPELIRSSVSCSSTILVSFAVSGAARLSRGALPK